MLDYVIAPSNTGKRFLLHGKTEYAYAEKYGWLARLTGTVNHVYRVLPYFILFFKILYFYYLKIT